MPFRSSRGGTAAYPSGERTVSKADTLLDEYRGKRDFSLNARAAGRARGESKGREAVLRGAEAR